MKTIARTTSEDFLMFENGILEIRLQYPLDGHIIPSNNSLVRFVSPQEKDLDTSFQQLRIATSPIAHYGNISRAELTNRIDAGHTKFGVDMKQNESKAIFPNNGNIANKLVYTFIGPQYGILNAQASNYLPIVQNDSLQVLKASDLPKILNNDGENQTNKFLAYTNDKYGISMHYPADWSKEEIDTTPRDYDIEVVQFYSPQSRAPGKYNVEFSIMIKMYRDENTPKNVDEELEHVIDVGNIWSTNFKIVESNANTTLASYPAYKIVWTEVIDDTPIKIMEKGIIIRGDVYVVKYRAELETYSIFLPIVQQMIDSLKINQSKATPH